MSRLAPSFLLVLSSAACLALQGCGGGGGSDPAPAPAPAPAPSPDPAAARVQAATATAQSTLNACAAVQPFYWEIGDKGGKLASGSVNKAGNTTTYDANSVMSIASASKWLYGAYVAERRNGMLTAEDIQFLNFRSGYTNFDTVIGCQQQDSVASCLARRDYNVQDSATIGKFFYNGGHMQRHASLPGGMNLGSLNNAGLAAELSRVLGTDITLAYSSPQIAGAVVTTPGHYAVFLRKMLNNQLRMSALLGAYPVCTNPATCADALSSPFTNGASWHYSIGHWVEDDPAAGDDGAFSSAGAFGFYPWIDASKTTYGVLARVASGGTGKDSAACGKLIRKAWTSGTAQ